MNRAATGVLGIDLGGTKIAAGIVDPASGAIILSETVPTKAASGGAVVLADTVELAKRLIAAAERGIVSIGLGVPQLVRERLSELAPTQSRPTFARARGRKPASVPARGGGHSPTSASAPESAIAW